MFRTNNPTWKPGIFSRFTAVDEADAMTVSGTMAKVALLIVLLVASATAGWVFPSIPLVIGSLIAGLIIAFVIAFKPELSPILAPIYAIVEGLAIGTISLIYQQMVEGTKYTGIVPLAVMGTFAVTFVMFALYSTRIIKVTQTFAMVVIGATVAVFLTYMATMVIGLFAPGIHNMPIYQSGPIGILFSVGVIVLAAFNL